MLSRFFRSEANVVSTLSSEEEIAQAKDTIAAEWVKENPEKAHIKSLLRDTFNDRSNLLKDGVSYDDFLKHYPCFKDSDFVSIII